MLSEFTFDHIGIATSCIEDTAKIYIDAGYSMSQIVLDPVQNVNISFLTKIGMPSIELLEPVNDSSPVKKTLVKNGVSPYHMCYRVDNIEYALKKLKALKYIPLSKPVPAKAFNSSLICFLFNKDVGLIELVEVNNNI